jgi:hypothetical protein
VRSARLSNLYKSARNEHLYLFPERSEGDFSFRDSNTCSTRQTSERPTGASARESWGFVLARGLCWLTICGAVRGFEALGSFEGIEGVRGSWNRITQHDGERSRAEVLVILPIKRILVSR